MIAHPHRVPCERAPSVTFQADSTLKRDLRSIPEDIGMSFETTSALAANSDLGTRPASMAEPHVQSSARLARPEWQELLDRWQRLQPYADRLATVFLDTLFARGADFHQVLGGGALE